MTKASIPSFDVRIKMLQAIGLCLAVELGPFAIIKYAFHATWSALITSYLAFAAPTVFILLLAWGLRAWEARSLSPRRLALGWALCVALFASMLTAAVAYTGMKIRLVNSIDLNAWAVASVLCALAASLTVYHQAYRILSQRISIGAANGS